MITFIGDVHGWLGRLDVVVAQAQGELIFVGDLIDRGPQVPEVLDRVHDLCEAGKARCLLGNHEWMLARVLGRGDADPDLEAFDAWIAGWGGSAVMAAYGVDTPAALKVRLGRHWPWLGELPWVLEGAVEHRRWTAVHAGLHPNRPFVQQLDELRRGWNGPWRDGDDPRPPPLFSKKWLAKYPSDMPADMCLVSGHIPVWQPLIMPQRIACDTSGGMPDRRLTGVIWPSGTVITSGSPYELAAAVAVGQTVDAVRESTPEV